MAARSSCVPLAPRNGRLEDSTIPSPRFYNSVDHNRVDQQQGGACLDYRHFIRFTGCVTFEKQNSGEK